MMPMMMMTMMMIGEKLIIGGGPKLWSLTLALVDRTLLNFTKLPFSYLTIFKKIKTEC